MDSHLLSSNQFVGGIPPEIGNRSMLKYISLSSNYLFGSIPRELCNLESLLEINLDGTLLSGTIENVFEQCTNLTQLVLGNNHIHGSITEYLSELPLVVLDLDSNNFTSIIPARATNLLMKHMPSLLNHEGRKCRLGEDMAQIMEEVKKTRMLLKLERQPVQPLAYAKDNKHKRQHTWQQQVRLRVSLDDFWTMEPHTM
ncbi:hypothetical protein KPL71_021386 [Citrus sinensis]|uniref:Uncharacterized protein n=1 Tax=Citrus sinensis TaxID=2711 RepID=A0ACB8JF11_CITSI|nr:hypothetical protein KPL71_021386 [Citrus sinensis]